MCLAPSALAQAEAPGAPEGEAPRSAGAATPARPDPSARERMKAFERAINRIRVTRFGNVRVQDIRNTGVEEVRRAIGDYAREEAKATGATAREAEPLAFPVLLEVFSRERLDVRLAALDIFAQHGSPEGDAALAWAAIFEDSPRELAPAIRAAAADRLVERLTTAPEGTEPPGATEGVRLTLAHALRQGDAQQASDAARLVNRLGLIEAIPALITAQVDRPASRTRQGPKAFIFVGNQRSFVADVTPVVGSNAVAFDPLIGTLNTGALLVVHDSLVTSYRTEVHEALVQLTSRAWGESTAYLGYDIAGWRKWWNDIFLPAHAAGQTRSMGAPGGAPGPGAPGSTLGAIPVVATTAPPAMFPMWVVNSPGWWFGGWGWGSICGQRPYACSPGFRVSRF